MDKIKKRKDPASLPLEELDISTRLYNFLKLAKCKTLGDLINYNEESLRSFSNFKESYITEIKSLLQDKKIKLIREKMKNTADALGKGIDTGIFDSVVYLNALGYHTRQSCDGHGDSYAWIDFQTPTEAQEEVLGETKQSIYWKVENDAKKIANEKLIEKFGEEYLNNLKYWPDNVADYWHEIYVHERDNHPQHTTYDTINTKMLKEYPALKKQIEDLKNEFISSVGESPDSISVDRTGRIDFAKESVIHKNEGVNESVILKSNDLVKKFESFLKKKYENKL